MGSLQTIFDRNFMFFVYNLLVPVLVAIFVGASQHKHTTLCSFLPRTLQ